MELLVASIVALALGPPLLALARSRTWALRLLDGFVYAAIGGLVLLHVLPEAVGSSGPLALVFAAVGLLGPSTIEHRMERGARQAHAAALFLGCIALGIHGVMDGVALAGVAEVGGGGTAGLGVAVVLHRLSDGLTLWWLLVPARGARTATWVLVSMALATVLGFGLGGAAGHTLAAPGMGLFYALVGGSLLHVVLHQPHPMARGEATGLARFAAGTGALAGCGLLVVLSLTDVEGPSRFWKVLVGLVLASAPALLLAFAAAGLVQEWLPRARLRWLSRGGAAEQALRGVAFGLPLPICSCGVVPLYRSLVLAGVPATAGMAFLVATPELGLDAVLLSVSLLGVPMTVARVICAAVVALLVGWGVGRFIRPVEPGRGDPRPEEARRGSPGSRVLSAARVGFGEIVDDTGPWILAGIALAAALAPALDAPWLTKLPDDAEVVLFALLGMPLYVCASGATPLVAVLVAAGVSPGAGIAFLLSGPATNVTTFGILSQLHGRRIAVAFAVAIAALCIALGTSVNLVLPSAAGAAFSPSEEPEGGPLAVACAVLLAAVFAASLLRQGPRAFFGRLGRQGTAPGDDDHSDDDGCHDGGCHDDGCHDDGCHDDGLVRL